MTSLLFEDDYYDVRHSSKQAMWVRDDCCDGSCSTLIADIEVRTFIYYKKIEIDFWQKLIHDEEEYK